LLEPRNTLNTRKGGRGGGIIRDLRFHSSSVFLAFLGSLNQISLSVVLLARTASAASHLANCRSFRILNFYEILSNVVYEKLKSASIPNLIKQPCP
jgi:hypothetical protein